MLLSPNMMFVSAESYIIDAGVAVDVLTVLISNGPLTFVVPLSVVAVAFTFPDTLRYTKFALPSELIDHIGAAR